MSTLYETDVPEFIRFQCPSCGKSLKARTHQAGKTVICPECRQHIRVDEPHKPTRLEQPATLEEQIAQEFEKPRRPIDYDLVKRFRQTAHLLGGLAIFLGLLNSLGGIAMLAGVLPRPPEEWVVAGSILFLVGLPLVIAGIFSCLKQPWAFYVVVGMSYVVVLLAVLSCIMGQPSGWLGMIIAGSMITNGKKGMKLADQMNAAGIPLHTRPKSGRRPR